MTQFRNPNAAAQMTEDKGTGISLFDQSRAALRAVFRRKARKSLSRAGDVWPLSTPPYLG